MVFTSSIFLFAFLPAFLLLYLISPRSLKSLTITVSSFVFYGWWRPDFVLLMLSSSMVDYLLAGRIVSDRDNGRGNGKRWLALSCIANLGLLGYFKYSNFGIDTFRTLMLALGYESSFHWEQVVLPVGISFYTFQTLSYTIDVYRGEVKLARNWIDFLCYVSMFPQLVAGPIVRYAVVEHELQTRQHTWHGFYQGILYLQSGLAKKVLIADMLAPVADTAFAAEHLQAGDAWLGIFAYALQIYFDFSGYSDMAIGLGLMIGFHFPINFDSPYRSQSITEFWRRWHMSLSTWLRDYLYISLGGNRRGPLRTYVNLSLTMVLGGFWHGASWNFIAWGGWQGFWLVIERLCGKRPWYGPAPALVRVAITFVLALFGWVLVRAADLSHALAFSGDMLLLRCGEATALDLGLLQWTALAAGSAVVWLAPTTQALVARASPWWAIPLQALFVLAILHLNFQSDFPFLYFQF